LKTRNALNADEIEKHNAAKTKSLLIKNTTPKKTVEINDNVPASPSIPSIKLYALIISRIVRYVNKIE
jgi:hypothetical protein